MEVVNFEKHKELAEAFYKQVGKVNCPALKAEVYFTSDGFHHLRYDNNRSERDKKVQLNKFKCLKFAIDILKQTTTLQEYRTFLQRVGKSDKSGLYKTAMAEYYGFAAIVGENRRVRVKVIVRKIGNGNFQFWSVMPYWVVQDKPGGVRVKYFGGRNMDDE